MQAARDATLTASLRSKWVPRRLEWCDPNTDLPTALGVDAATLKTQLQQLSILGRVGGKKLNDAQLRDCFGDGWGLQRWPVDFGKVRWRFMLLGPGDAPDKVGPIEYAGERLHGAERMPPQSPPSLPPLKRRGGSFTPAADVDMDVLETPRDQPTRRTRRRSASTRRCSIQPPAASQGTRRP